MSEMPNLFFLLAIGCVSIVVVEFLKHNYCSRGIFSIPIHKHLQFERMTLLTLERLPMESSEEPMKISDPEKRDEEQAAQGEIKKKKKKKSKQMLVEKEATMPDESPFTENVSKPEKDNAPKINPVKNRRNKDHDDMTPTKTTNEDVQQNFASKVASTSSPPHEHSTSKSRSLGDILRFRKPDESAKIVASTSPGKPSKAEHEGWLSKKEGTVRKVWKRRYFRKFHSKLLFYEDEKCTEELGVILLSPQESVSINHDDLTFNIVASGSTVTLKTESKSELFEWVDKIKRSFEMINSTPTSNGSVLQHAATVSNLPRRPSSPPKESKTEETTPTEDASQPSNLSVGDTFISLFKSDTALVQDIRSLFVDNNQLQLKLPTHVVGQIVLNFIENPELRVIERM